MGRAQHGKLNGNGGGDHDGDKGKRRIGRLGWYWNRASGGI
jgi:hypothetical protein